MVLSDYYCLIICRLQQQKLQPGTSADRLRAVALASPLFDRVRLPQKTNFLRLCVRLSRSTQKQDFNEALICRACMRMLRIWCAQRQWDASAVYRSILSCVPWDACCLQSKVCWSCTRFSSPAHSCFLFARNDQCCTSPKYVTSLEMVHSTSWRRFCLHHYCRNVSTDKDSVKSFIRVQSYIHVQGYLYPLPNYTSCGTLNKLLD